MNRVRQAQAEAVGEALKYVPVRLHEKLGHDLFCADPIFAGLYVPSYSNEDSPVTGVSYRSAVHVGWPYHCRDRRTTIVWPTHPKADADPVATAIHELGHVLHGHLAERAGWQRLPRLWNVSKYARTNYEECFAEAFVAWAAYSPRAMDEHPYWPWGYRRENAEWFDRLLRD